MREVLFRGFHPNENGSKTITTTNGVKVKGEWVEGQLCDFYHREYDAFLPHICARFDSVDVIPETVGQYIGLSDKNGNRIFEGDIVQAITLYSNAIRHAVVGIGECVDEEEGTCFGANLSWEGVVGIFYAEYLNYIELIGNIYENPELLEVEQ